LFAFPKLSTLPTKASALCRSKTIEGICVVVEFDDERKLFLLNLEGKSIGGGIWSLLLLLSE